MSKLSEIGEQFSAAYQKINDEGEEALKEAFKEFFDKNPCVYAIEWYQYTPYFNDGDTCTFRVGGFEPNFEFEEEEEEEEEEEDSPEAEDEAKEASAEATEAYAAECEKANDELSELESDCFDDLLLSIFGDHVKVCATRDGFEVSEYHHD